MADVMDEKDKLSDHNINGATDVMDDDSQLEENEGAGKNWSLENDEDDEDDSMGVDTEQTPVAEPTEDTFLALPKQDDDDDKADALVSKPPVRRNMMAIGKGVAPNLAASASSQAQNQTSATSKSKMRFGFGMAQANKANGAPKKSKVTSMKIDRKTEQKPQPEEKMEVDGNDEIDPLEAYMVDVDAAVQRLNEEDMEKCTNSTSQTGEVADYLMMMTMGNLLKKMTIIVTLDPILKTSWQWRLRESKRRIWRG